VLAKAGMPTVSVGRPPGKPAVPYVDADNRAGAHLAVNLLVDLLYAVFDPRIRYT
jgi:DNA-binding LacI/PurR family transcriptional regulator